MQLTRYQTSGGVTVQREVWLGPYEREHDTLARILDSRRGVLFSSSFEFPGRYTRLDMGFVDPPFVLTARGRAFSVEALNPRGRILLDAVENGLTGLPVTDSHRTGEDRIEGEVRESDTRFPEEQRSRQPSIFSVLPCSTIGPPPMNGSAPSHASGAFSRHSGDRRPPPEPPQT